LGAVQLFLCTFALDKLTDLTAQSCHHVEQFLIRLAYLVTEELHHGQDLCAEQDRKSECRMQDFAKDDGCPRKVGITSDVRDIYRLTTKPNAARQSDSRHERGVATGSLEFRHLYRFFVPNPDATQYSGL